MTEWRAEVRRGGGDFHYLLLRVSQQDSGPSKLTLFPPPHKLQMDSRYVETSIVLKQFETSLGVYLFLGCLSHWNGQKPSEGRAWASCTEPSLEGSQKCLLNV